MVKDKDLYQSTPSLERKRPNIAERQAALSSRNNIKESAAEKQTRLESEMAKRSKDYDQWLRKSKQMKLG